MTTTEELIEWIDRCIIIGKQTMNIEVAKNALAIKCALVAAHGMEKALRSVKYDFENCDWRCSVCGSDPVNTETDAYIYASEALAAWEKATKCPT